MDTAEARKQSEGARIGRYVFGDFTLDRLRRTLSRTDGTRMDLPPRAFNALELFVDRPGELLYKDWLIAVLWPGMVVDENNLSQIISTLRRALGDDRRSYIQTEARRGFRFVCPVVHTSVPQVSLPLQSVAKTTLAGPDARGPKLVILPFLNLDQDPAQDYFVAGMTEEVAAALTRIRSLVVIRVSTDMTQAAEFALSKTSAGRLGVRYLLEGSVRRAGQRVRIAVKLSDSEQRRQIWSERFEGTLEDIFALQDRVALDVAGAIEPSIREVEARRATREPLESLDCYDLYLRAAHLRATLRRDAVFEALRLLDRALVLDAGFAPALAQAAGCHSQIFASGWTDDPDFHCKRGKELAESALQACHDDAGVLAQVANALMDLEVEPAGNIDQALGLITRATELNPGSAFAWFISGVLHLIDNRGDVAAEHLQRAMQLDPVSPLHGIARSHLGIALAVMGHYPEALNILRAASNLSPRAQLMLACVSSELRLLPQARADLDRFEQMTPIAAQAMAARMTRHGELRAWILAAVARIRGT